MAEQQTPEEREGAEIEAVLALLAVGGTMKALSDAVAAVLTLPAGAVYRFFKALGKEALEAFTRVGTGAPGSAVERARRANLRYRAAFIRNALHRLTAPGVNYRTVLGRELEFWRAHLVASRRRTTMAGRVDVARKRHGELLGWYAVGDERTTAECRAADGRNFNALAPPSIGYPGGVHPRCRCVPGAPHPGGKMVSDSLTVRRHGGLYR